MENASKALIIAGAILLSILLISLGIMVFNNAKGTVDDANLSEQEVQVFNEKLTPFIGTNKTPNDIKNLLDTLMAIDPNSAKVNLYPINNFDGDLSRKRGNNSNLGVYYGGKTNASGKTGVLKDNGVYTVYATYYKATGMISSIVITPNPFNLIEINN